MSKIVSFVVVILLATGCSQSVAVSSGSGRAERPAAPVKTTDPAAAVSPATESPAVAPPAPVETTIVATETPSQPTPDTEPAFTPIVEPTSISGTNLTMSCEWDGIEANDQIRTACNASGVPSGAQVTWQLSSPSVIAEETPTTVTFDTPRAALGDATVGFSVQGTDPSAAPATVDRPIVDVLPHFSEVVDRCLKTSSEALAGCFSGSLSVDEDNNIVVAATPEAPPPVEPPLPPTRTLVGLEISPPSAIMASGTTRGFTARARFSDDSTEDVTADATWSSRQPAVVSIASGNDVSASTVAPGTGRIVAELDGQSAEAEVVVTTATLQSITITSASATIEVGSRVQLTATGTYTDASTADLTTTASWTSLATDNVAMDEVVKGRAKGLATGSAVVRAVVDSFQHELEVTIVPRTSSVVLHFDASKAQAFNGGSIANGASVTLYVENSAAARSATVLQAANVIYVADAVNARPAVKLNGTAALRFAHDDALAFTAFTVAVVGKRSSKLCWQLLFIKDNPGSWSSGFGMTDRNCSGTESWEMWVNSYGSPATAVTIGPLEPRPFILIATYKDGVLGVLDERGQKLNGSVNPYVPNTLPFSIGGYAAADLLVSELRLVDRALPQGDQEALMEALKVKWGF